MVRLLAETLLHTVLLPGTVIVLLPALVLAREGRLHHPALSASALLGVLLIALGLAVGGWCTRDFIVKGRGTPNPLDPPKAVVASGPYRHVRNPMYVSVAAILVGEVLVFRSLRLLAYTAAVVAVFHLFVVLYEEPTLRRLFGASYDAYCGRVPRWLPRLSGRSRAS